MPEFVSLDPTRSVKGNYYNKGGSYYHEGGVDYYHGGGNLEPGVRVRKFS